MTKVYISEEYEKDPVYVAARETCIKILDIIKQDSIAVDNYIIEEEAVKYYGTICSTVTNTILINLIKGLRIPDKDSRDEYFMHLTSEIGKHAIQAYLTQMYAH